MIRALGVTTLALLVAGCGGSGGGGGGGDPEPGGPVPLTPRQFVHVATAANLSGAFTEISHPSLDDDPSEPFVVTQVVNPDGAIVGVTNPHPIGITYNAALGRWMIFNQDYADMPEGAAFFVALGGGLTTFTHTATTANRAGNYTRIADGHVDGRPNARMIVTQHANALPDAAFVPNPAEIGLWYESGTWRIFNQDRSSMPLGADFVVVIPPVDWGIHHATAANIAGASRNMTYFNFAPLFDHPLARIQVTADWNVDDDGVYNDHPVALYYDVDARRWAIVNTDGGEMQVGASFTVWFWAP